MDNTSLPVNQLATELRKKPIPKGSIDAILGWLEEAIHIGDFEDILETDAINVFLSVFVLVSYNHTDTAIIQLAAWQRYIALNISHYLNLQFSHRQRNLVLDIVHEVEDELDEPDKSSAFEPLPKVSESGYMYKCQRWQQSLQENLLNTSEDSIMTFESKQRIVALTIQSMKKKSGLATTILKLSHPAYGYNHSQDPHHARLLRLHGFGLVLGDVLDRWTPKIWTSDAERLLSCNPVLKYNTSNNKQMIKGKDLFNAFIKHPLLIPHVANPAAVYFLCSEENFTAAWEQWLSWSLDAAGYKVYDVKVSDLYRNTMKYLNNIGGNTHNLAGIRTTWDPTILLIVEQTLLLRDLLKDLDAQPPQKRCVQRIDVTLNEKPEFISQWRGVGISKVPPEQQMKPQRGRNATRGVAQIVHPDKIGVHGLKRITADEEVLQRCGKQIFKLFRNNELCDFVWYNAFPDSTFVEMLQYSQSALGVQPVHRGSRFSFWTSGQMIPFGARQPSGGRRADHYTSYAGITAETYEGIIILFEQAKLSAMLMRTARAIHPGLVNKINEQSKACERVGYTAPQHCDEDCTPSLCAQFELQAEQKWSEFAFCAIQYGYYIETRRNMLWSFDSGLLHGTMLPSAKTVLRLRGGAASSEGTHVTTRRRDQQQAEHNQEVRRNYYLREGAWRNHQ
ncbi:hypothetical protein BDP27DRAFT_1376340 [Rhodocollybia butyracea]|uniref:Uncharacterized protein n=1 Tax=Rhodocollybia butyracea TaxID=206335 RepID=A0A9P5P1I7_9AGAR|nr:hypothetical protein BDP27DRAFT_1376340 [Rhodocollybia butyracea]